MADNVAVTAGSGTSIAADEVVDGTLGTVKVQFVKLMDGTLDGSTKAEVGANGLAVDVKAIAAGTNAIGKLAANSGVDIGDVDVLSIAAGDNNIGNVDIASIAAGETVIGKVGASDIQVSVTPTLSTSAYTSGDVLFTATEIANAARTSGGVMILQSVVVIDKDDETAVPIDLYFFDRTVTMAANPNDTPAISDADALYCQGVVSIAAADWKDLGGVKVACVKGIGLAMKANATSLFVAAVVTGTPTYANASDMGLTFTFLRS